MDEDQCRKMQRGEKRNQSRGEKEQGTSKRAKTKDCMIGLNVGGKIYTTSLSTLTKYPDSMLGKMFGGDIPSKQDAQGNYVIDRDGKLFRYVLTFLRSSKLTLPENFQEMDMLAEEAEFFQIPDLIEAVKTYRTEDCMIGLNVGGKIYTTSLSTLTKYPDSMLGKMVGGDIPSMQDVQGNYVIDRDGELFRYVLTFLRSSKLTLPENFQELDMLAEEAEFFQIPDLIEAVITMGQNAVYMLNVGGTVYPVLRKYLEPNQETRTINNMVMTGFYHIQPVLGDLWSKITSPDAPRDQHGNYVIDGDPILFRYILNFIRTRKFYLPSGFSEFEQLQADIKHFGMNFSVTEYIKKTEGLLICI